MTGASVDLTQSICGTHTGAAWCGPAVSGSRIGLIILLAVVVQFVGHRTISRLVSRTADGLPVPLRKMSVRARSLFDSEPSSTSERRRQRAETIGSVLRSILSFMVLTIALVMVLDALGLNIAPLLTGAGIAGVAVGFGAQNLVKDFLSGIFMILEDQYGVGDWIDAGMAAGTVEAVGLRTTRLRDADGTVWHLRNGEILRIGNFNQGWSRVVIDVPISYAQPIDRAQQVVLAAATSVAADPDYADMVLDPPTVPGVQSYEEKWLTLRVVVRTRARQQEEVSRAVRLAIKNALDADGIQSPAAAMVNVPTA
ncbi:MAG: moderate conductance mechanosensitive channel [Frankiales bacterium]|nr:moderate conductance mechanosensitive channel [Frankiales bacterium]